MPLGERYVLARTKWRMIFEREGGEKAVEVESTFLVDMGGESPRILMYLAHNDAIQEASRTVK
jgi:hypothetical protein